MLLRTAKSCGPDAPTLASSLRMASRPNRARTGPIFRKRRWQKSPVTGESTKETVKTIACGMPGDPGGPVATTRVHYQLRTRGYGCNGHPAFPTPSRGREINAQLGRFAPRGANACLLFDNLHHPTRRPCESRDPYAVPCHFGRGGRGLLPQRTPVAMGPCFRRDDERVRMRLPIFARSDLSAVAQRAKAEGALQSGLGHIG